MAVNRIKGAFQTPKKGETFELRAGLVSQYAYERKEAIQKTIMSMTLGKDVSALFPDVPGSGSEEAGVSVFDVRPVQNNCVIIELGY
jgi:hypothetical protein